MNTAGWIIFLLIGAVLLVVLPLWRAQGGRAGDHPIGGRVAGRKLTLMRENDPSPAEPHSSDPGWADSGSGWSGDFGGGSGGDGGGGS
jgi:uncharacterized membrane protein YgcG